MDLLGLPAGARLKLGAAALVVLTGLRTPCTQLEELQPEDLLQGVRHDRFFALAERRAERRLQPVPDLADLLRHGW